MQVDFTIIRQGRCPLLAFVAPLGGCRATYVRFYARQDTAAWGDGIKHALAFFGGTPRHLLFDNAKAIILERDVYGDGRHRWNPLLLALAEEYGFSPRVCRPYRAKTKGKVERFNRYIKESFVVPLATTFKQSGLMLDVDSANARGGLGWFKLPTRGSMALLVFLRTTGCRRNWPRCYPCLYSDLHQHPD